LSAAVARRCRGAGPVDSSLLSSVFRFGTTWLELELQGVLANWGAVGFRLRFIPTLGNYLCGG